jgi:Glyoxalase/Bleomycin resistance protein/Dioxygenase superfamily
MTSAICKNLRTDIARNRCESAWGVIMKLANSWLILNVGGGPTDDKPTVTLTTPGDPSQASAFLNIRVADMAAAYTDWSARGAEFLTEPKDHGRELRAYIRDPDGHPDRGWPGHRPPGLADQGEASPRAARPRPPISPAQALLPISG